MGAKDNLRLKFMGLNHCRGKPDARNAIDQAARDKEAEFQAVNTKLTDEEKAAAIKKVQDAARDAKAAIGSSWFNGDVNNAVNQGNIQAIKALDDRASRAKDTAKAAIQNAADAGSAAITANNS